MPADYYVSLVKKNGKKFENIRAMVGAEQIFIEDGTLSIEKGDQIERQLGDGKMDVFFVVNPGYCPAISTFKADYQVKVSREGVEAELQPKKAEGPVSEARMRTFIKNLVGSSPEQVFNVMRILIKEKIAEPEQAAWLALAGALETSRGTPAYPAKYKELMRLSGDYLTAITPLLPVLSEWL